MQLSYVIISRNRRERLLQTLAQLQANTPLPVTDWETIVVDNGSEDGSPAAVTEAFPRTKVISLSQNMGMPARNRAFALASGEFIVSLDDDSYPAPGAIELALSYLKFRPIVGALTARAVLPNGNWEASAFPAVMLGGACVLRKRVIDQVGGFPEEFFRQAEEYDLSFRIWQAGYRVERHEGLIFRHDKSPGGRSSAMVHEMDLCNNLILIERYLPRELRRAYRHDWIRRYAAFARQDGCADAVTKALSRARCWAARERSAGRQVLTTKVLDTLFQFTHQANTIARWATGHGIRRVCLADFSKNFYASWRACKLANLKMLGIVDDRPAFAGQCHRGLAFLTSTQAQRIGAEGIILTNINPAQIDERLNDLRRKLNSPILRLWSPPAVESAVLRAA